MPVCPCNEDSPEASLRLGFEADQLNSAYRRQTNRTVALDNHAIPATLSSLGAFPNPRRYGSELKQEAQLSPRDRATRRVR